MARWLAHLIGRMNASKHFAPATLDAIQHAIATSEHRHLGEICFAVEGGLPIPEIFSSRKPRERAHDVFSRLRVWDTDNNTGVLVYILIGDHAIEIVADRGIAAKVAEEEWAAVCALMQQDFSQGEYRRGAIAGVDAITEILVRHFPSDGQRNPDELPDRPILL